MNRMLINATQLDELRVAITHNTLLIDLDIERPGIEQKKANIYKGRISSIEPSLAAVFVDYGSERHGFLPLKEISPEYFNDYDPNTMDEASVDINKVLRIGQPVVVQVDKEERGSKGAALTTFLSLAGSYLVLMPNNPRAGGISRRIEGEDRDQLKDTLSQLQLPEGMGVIIRTAGVNRNIEELQWDLDVLLRYFEAIKQAVALRKSPPYLIHQESDVIIRTLRDYLRQDISEVIIDETDAHHRALNYIQQVRPDFADRLKLYQDDVPLFSRFQIEQQIETAYQREVRLPSGGSIVIDQTEALVSIDINSARATKGKSIEETAYNTNIEATEEIARQLRLRDIGGLIVIDFIDMMQVRNQRDVENNLRQVLHLDRARIQIGRISRFGLLEMSRQRLRSAINKTARVSCPRCNGTGVIRSVESLGYSIIHLIQEQTAKNDKINFQVQVPVDVATFLINEQRQKMAEIERNSGARITVVPNPHLQTPHYNIRHIRRAGEEDDIPSYKLLRNAKSEIPSLKSGLITKDMQEPAIKQFLTDNGPTQTHPKFRAPSTEGGAISRLIRKLFHTNTSDLSKEVLPRKSSAEHHPSSTQTTSQPIDRSQHNSQPALQYSEEPPFNRREKEVSHRRAGDEEQHAHKRTRRGGRGGQGQPRGLNQRDPRGPRDQRGPQRNQRPQEETRETREFAVPPVKSDTVSISTPSPATFEKLPQATQQVSPPPAVQNGEARGANKPIIQSQVEQREMKAGRRISPSSLTSTTTPTTPKPTYQPGRKIAGPGEKVGDSPTHKE